MTSLLSRQANDPLSVKLFRALPTAKSRFEYLCLSYDPHRDGSLLAGIEYQHFLGTVYWRILRDYLLWKRGSACEQCARTGLMILHHKSYEHHGSEHRHLDELEFLCRECHDAEHVPIAAEVEKLLNELAGARASPAQLPQPVVNDAYDPRTFLNLHDYGDIRGRAP